jgi:hypothetical protein
MKSKLASSAVVAWFALAGCGNDGSREKSSTGGSTSAGGQPASAGSSGANGGITTGQGGSIGAGGASGSGGSAVNGGAVASGGVNAVGGTAATGGAATSGGFSAAGGGTGAGGSNHPDAGAGGVSGATATGGAAGSGGATGVTGPCDIYQAGSTPCVAAHSTVRALYGSYSKSLYQVRRASDKSTRDVPVLGPGGYADSSVQDSFCSGTKCTISIIYDQSANGNHLTKSPPGGWLKNGGLEADAAAAKVKVAGHTVYGVYTTSNFDDNVGAVGYRNNDTKGIATGDEPEAMYMVASGKHYNQWCCFDYGNAERNNLDNGKATMEAVYFGNSTQWGKGSGAGPWVMADLEDGIYAGGSTAAAPTNTSLVADYVTAMLKGPSGNRFVLKGGDAQSGRLATKYDGPRPAGYSPQKKEGAIILGTGGDNSHTGEGTFFEGCMTAGVPSDAEDDGVQANIVAAGYGR